MLDLDAIAPDRMRPLLRAEYDKLVELGAFEDERIELLRGALVTMSPIGAPHSSIVQRLNELLLPRLLGRASVRIQSPFAALDDSEPEPDVAIYPHGTYAKAHPEAAWLLIEVADSSLRKDRGLKARIYAEARVEEYWIIDVVGRALEVYRDARAGEWSSVTVLRPGDAVAPLRFPELRLAITDLLVE